MKDTFNREINYLRISVTDRCDLRCIYCMKEKMEFLPKSQILSVEEIDRICSVFINLGIKKIPGLNETLNEFVLVKKKPIFGICVGMQLFAKTGYESQETKGFGWIDAEVRKINNMNKKLKLPHMGWNEIELKKDCFLFSNIKNKSHMYFIHSYEFMTKQKDCVVATTNYGNSITASVSKENIVGTQFHPEKSQKNGLIILENFLKWKL